MYKLFTVKNEYRKPIVISLICPQLQLIKDITFFAIFNPTFAGDFNLKPNARRG